VRLSVEPEAGSLLYWHVRRPNSQADTRMTHMGCPVLYGNKWIVNKWINANEQMNRCSTCLLLSRDTY
jgi:prolyl 4-hydroxylase